MATYHLALVAQAQGDASYARQLFGESVGFASEVGNKVYVVYGLEGLGMIVAGQAQHVAAARLFGAAQVLLDAMGLPEVVGAPDRALYTQTVAQLRHHLGEQAFAAAWAEGRAMSVEQALALATPT